MDPTKVMHESESLSDIEPFLVDSASKKSIYVENVNEAHISVPVPLGDVSGFRKNGSGRNETMGVSIRDWSVVSQTNGAPLHGGQYGQNILGSQHLSVSRQEYPARIFDPLVKVTGCRGNFGKAKMTSSVLGQSQDARMNAIGKIGLYSGFNYTLSHTYVT